LAPSIVKCYGISQDPETKNFILVMQYVHDGNLGEYLRKNIKMTWNNILFHLRTISKGLERIHEKGFVHGDLHIGNILYNWSGSVITDLGLCVPIDEPSCDKIGVVPYMPEVLNGQAYTKSSDVHSFGMIAHHVISGSPPYPGAHDD